MRDARLDWLCEETPRLKWVACESLGSEDDIESFFCSITVDSFGLFRIKICGKDVDAFLPSTLSDAKWYCQSTFQAWLSCRKAVA